MMKGKDYCIVPIYLIRAKRLSYIDRIKMIQTKLLLKEYYRLNIHLSYIWKRCQEDWSKYNLTIWIDFPSVDSIIYN